MSEPKMPALPKPRFTDCGVVMNEDGYTADQMHAYALTAIDEFKGEVIRGELDSLVHERDEARQHAATIAAERDALRVEVDGLRKDAGRYQLARRVLMLTAIDPLMRDYFRFGDYAYMQKVDAALDKALATRGPITPENQDG